MRLIWNACQICSFLITKTGIHFKGGGRERAGRNAIIFSSCNLRVEL
jgi:hypothetical protein